VRSGHEFRIVYTPGVKPDHQQTPNPDDSNQGSDAPEGEGGGEIRRARPPRTGSGARPAKPRTSPRPSKAVRLQRILANAGIAARRVAEAMIEEGRVSVNGKVVSELPAFADPERDHIVVDGRPISKQPVRYVYIMLNKPQRVLSVVTDEPGLDRTTIMDLVKHPTAPRLFPVGRLEFETAGLVLLTNDGELANRLTHPRYGIPRTYRAIVKGSLDQEAVATMQRELSRLLRRENRRRLRDTGPGKRPAAPLSGDAVAIQLEKREVVGGVGRTTLRITVREGRTISAPPGVKQAAAAKTTSYEDQPGPGAPEVAGGASSGGVGELLAAVGLRVRSLERIAIGPLELANVARGRWRELERREIHALRAAARGQGPKTPTNLKGPAPARPPARHKPRPPKPPAETEFTRSKAPSSPAKKAPSTRREPRPSRPSTGEQPARSRRQAPRPASGSPAAPRSPRPSGPPRGGPTRSPRPPKRR
jgi:23S rRNA pseudouridine2605 synthase